ncbi:Non-catalytic module family DOC2 [Piromyces sp. E2]|nr:Non-catalytic module family DOC2 [Piromyces sp. E2]|eukprot:OUM61517.1 Non-catalytic module family DOC2 [Piromyces sp. E2]
MVMVIENNESCAIRHSQRPWNDRELIDETRDEWNAFKLEWEKEKYNFERLSVFVGTSEVQTEIKNVNKKEKTSTIFDLKINGEKYYTNRVTVSNIERNSKYYYQRYINGGWEKVTEYKTYDDKNFKFIFVGDPQIGGSRGRYRPFPKFKNTTTDDEGNRNDAFNWNRVINNAFKYTKTPNVFLSAGDQADEVGDYNYIVNQESEYSAFLYPKKLKQIVMATSVGNHEVSTNSFGRHFNTPNPLTNSTVTRNYNGWYTRYNYFFKYNNVLVVVLETNHNREDDYKTIVRNAIMKYPEMDWRIALFHHDIFGIGSTHSQSDALERRAVVFNVLSKYNFDLVINGHDHVYSSSKFVSYETKNKNSTRFYSEDNYEIEEIKKDVVNKNPKGTFFVTANCSSGSKFLAFYEKKKLNYIFNHKQTFTPTFGTLDFTQYDGKVALNITTFDAETFETVDGSYIFEKDAGSHIDKCWSEKVRGLPCCPLNTKPTNKENGRLYGYHRKDHCGIVDIALLPDSKCWAKKYGKDCCILQETEVVNTDERGQWGEEFGEECGIVEGYTKYNFIDDPITYNTKCWSDELGYKCCSKGNNAVYDITEDGEWGYEDGNWCGIISEDGDGDKENPGEEECWSKRKGYECCSPNAVVMSTDKDGDWGYENGHWCGIIKCWSKELGFKCCSNVEAEVLLTDKNGSWGVENGQWCGIIKQTSVKPTPPLTKTRYELKPIETPTPSDSKVIDKSEEPVVSESCLAEQFGYKCCTKTKVCHTDEMGTWGYENNEWCIIELSASFLNNDEPVKSKCVDENLTNGYTCCKNPNTEVAYTDKDGTWGVEKNNWCVIEQYSIVVEPTTTTTTVEPTTTTTTVEPITTTTTVEPVVTPTPCLAEYKYGKKCCSNANTIVSFINTIGTWGRENNEWCVIEMYEKECWSEKLGYKCCSNPYVKEFYVDINGSWGVENNNWCGIVEDRPTGCWAEKYGSKCCINPDAEVVKTDNYGQWGFEYGNYCGLIEKPTCWSESLGYNCCTDPHAEIAYTDNSGNWGVENNNWCGIINN